MRNYLKGFKIKHFNLTYLLFLILLVYGISFAYFSNKFSDKPLNCANSITCIKDLSGKYNQGNTEGVFSGQKVQVPQYLASNGYIPSVLGVNNPSNKRIYVDLTNQRVYAYEGSRLVYNFLVSTGKWGKTPTGNFNIWIKLRYTLMAGGNKSIGTYYYLPNVPYTMYFYNNDIPKERGYGLHGTYWHSNFGHPMSHGCVNLRTEDAEKLYYWSDPNPLDNSVTYSTAENLGTSITIYGTAPNE